MRRVVDGVSFSLRAGEVVGLVGSSGSGKTMIALSLLRMVPPPGRIAAGRVEISGEDLFELSGEALRRLRGGRIALVAQDPSAALDPLFRVGEQVAEVARAHGMSRTQAREEARRRLAQMDLAPTTAASYPFDLSGGQRQRASIAAALAGRPSFLVADEATSALDATLQGQVLARLARLAEEGLGVLLITHDLALVASYCARVLVLSKGRLVESGPSSEVLGAARDPATRDLLDAVPRLGGAGRREEPPGEGALPPPERRPILLEGRSLRRIFPLRRGLFGARVGEVRAVDGADFEIAAGEAVGLVGESGSGKTTIGRLLVGLDRPTEGSVAYRGTELRSLPRRDRARARLRLPMIFQDPWGALDPRSTVEESVGEALRARGLPRGARREAALGLLDRVGLPADLLRRYPHELSGGQRQRASIARALGCEPELIVADEPTSALDTVSRAQILALLADLHRTRGLSFLLISHDLAAVEQIAERIYVLYAGKVVESGPARELIARPLHPYTEALVAAVPSVDPIQKEGAQVSGPEARGEILDPRDAKEPLGGESVAADGCPYRLRCPIARPACAERVPELSAVAESRAVACFFPGEAGLVGEGDLSKLVRARNISGREPYMS